MFADKILDNYSQLFLSTEDNNWIDIIMTNFIESYRSSLSLFFNEVFTGHDILLRDYPSFLELMKHSQQGISLLSSFEQTLYRLWVNFHKEITAFCNFKHSMSAIQWKD
jgi:hypothetical protein